MAKLTLTAHITFSVGWVGAVAAFLAVAASALTSPDPGSVKAAYLTMDLLGRVVLVPLSIASLVTGLIQSLGTKWGLFRHYWVIGKLVINLFANVVLLMYIQTLKTFASVASAVSSAGPVPALLRDPSAVLHSGGALAVLLVAIVLSVYKPKGLTPYGWRKQQEQRVAAL